MIIWPAKDPDEVADYTWTPPLDSGDTITTFTAVRTAGTVTKQSQSNTGTVATVWLMGGADGETSTFTLTVTTAGGRTFETTASILVAASNTPLLTAFRIRYPKFAAVGDGAVLYWITDAARFVGETWRATDRDPATLAYAAHMLADTGALTSTIPAGVTSFRSGAFSATIADGIAALTGFASTAYGREFLALRRANFAAPFLVGDPCGVPD